MEFLVIFLFKLCHYRKMEWMNWIFTVKIHSNYILTPNWIQSTAKNGMKNKVSTYELKTPKMRQIQSSLKSFCSVGIGF